MFPGSITLDNIFHFLLAGKVGGFIASIPDVMVAALLCFMWAMLTALGLSNLRYSEAGSSRNIIIVGLSLFFSLSIPAYFQQYGISPNSNMAVPSYFQPFIVASHGPIRTKYHGVYINALRILKYLSSHFQHIFFYQVLKKDLFYVFAVKLHLEYTSFTSHGGCILSGCNIGQHRTWE